MSEEREQLEARIAAYIDGELPESEAARLEVFLANTDPQLAEQVIGMMGDKQRVHGLPRPAAPADLAQRVMERVERATLLNDVDTLAQPRRSWWQSRLATAAAAIVLVGGFGWMVVSAVTGHVKHSGWPQITETKKDHRAAAPVGSSVAGSDAIGPGDMARDRDKRGADLDGAAIASAPKFGLPPAGLPGGTGGGNLKKNDQEQTPELRTMAPAKGAAERSDKLADAAGERPPVEVEKEEKVVQEQLAASSNMLNGAAEAGAHGYISAESAAKALATLSVSESQAASTPIVVTLVAQDNQDPAKLRTALEEFMGKDSTASRQKPLLARYAEGNGHVNNSAVSNGGIDNNLGNAANNTSNVAGNIAGKSIGNAVAVSNDGYLIFNGEQFNPVENTFNKTRSQVFANNRESADQYASQNNGQAQYDNNNLALPYRVMLREDQLQQLSRRFRVYSVSSGGQKFIISEPTPRIATANAPAAAPGKPAAALPTDAKENPKPESIAAAISATQPGSPAGQVVADAAKHEAQNAQAEEAKKLDSPATAQQASAVQKDAKLKWLDCVIRMEPSPVRANARQQTAPARENP